MVKQLNSECTYQLGQEERKRIVGPAGDRRTLLFGFYSTLKIEANPVLHALSKSVSL
jgi:hypothetical protein